MSQSEFGGGTPAAERDAPVYPGDVSAVGGYEGTGQGSPSAGADSGTATAAKEQPGQVATTAAQGAKDVAGEAKSQAASVLGDATAEARDVIGEARNELRQQASQQTDRAAQGLRTLAGQIQALHSGRPESAGPVGDYARQIGEKVQALAERVESGGFDGVVDDVRRFARRRPGVFLFGAAAAGFAVGRLVRSSTGGGDGRKDTGYDGYPDALAGPGLSESPTLYAEPAGYVGAVDPVSGQVDPSLAARPTYQAGSPHLSDPSPGSYPPAGR
jgi:hypothetical protein